MLKLLECIFGCDEEEKYPESLIKEAIERAVDGTDPQLRGISGYRKKLRPAVIRAIDHVVALVNALPSPMPVRLAAAGADLPIRNFFISSSHMTQIFREDPALADFMRGPSWATDQVFALLAMEKQEKVVLGASLSGEVVQRGVPQITVSFDAHRFIDPTGMEWDTRRLLKRRAYDHLLTHALRRLSDLKWERKDLERRRALLQAKLNLLEREGWGFQKALGAERSDITEVEGMIARLEGQLQELGGDDRMLDAYLDTVASVLGRPQEHMKTRREVIFVDRMGIKHPEASEGTKELLLDELENEEGRSIVVTLVSLDGKELRP